MDTSEFKFRIDTISALVQLMGVTRQLTGKVGLSRDKDLDDAIGKLHKHIEFMLAAMEQEDK